MPLIEPSIYQRPFYLFNAHLETIYPALFRKVSLNPPEKERIITPDQDFLDLDWYRNGQSKLIIISHGLEGNSTRAYMLGMAQSFLKQGFDVLCWNFRSCGEELNQQLIFYHSGATYDLDLVISKAQQNYDSIHLIGFSLGGNLTLKYLGEKGNSISKIKSAVAISVPLHLSSSSKKISELKNTLYSKRFLKSLKRKVMEKETSFPEEISLKNVYDIKTLSDFDNQVTGPLHGFADAEEYYEVNSSLYYLDQIKVPTLILNAQNDPFLSGQCFPRYLLKSLSEVYGEFPLHGGHVGFTPSDSDKSYYSELRAVEFITGVG